ncbi:MAG: hypothetical protein D6729_09785 [Deltaproteobacteria bacterium]|nr:MAG: hypothetical protein D6729_09785 [Deltaproteobacteria bacterium]
MRRHPAVETLWARAQVRALLHAAAAAADPTPLLRAAGSIGLQHGLAGAENAALTVDTAP